MICLNEVGHGVPHGLVLGPVLFVFVTTSRTPSNDMKDANKYDISKDYWIFVWPLQSEKLCKSRDLEYRNFFDQNESHKHKLPMYYIK